MISRALHLNVFDQPVKKDFLKPVKYMPLDPAYPEILRDGACEAWNRSLRVRRGGRGSLSADYSLKNWVS
jgi:hypothetical protein